MSAAGHTRGTLVVVATGMPPNGPGVRAIVAVRAADGTTCPFAHMLQQRTGDADAARLVRCWNAHDQLVMALDRLLESCLGRQWMS